MDSEKHKRDQDYRVLARKYRPKDFNHLIGQEVLVKTLSGAIQRGRIAHAYVLTGVRGVGKTTTARILAKCFNCLGDTETGKVTIQPCGKCELCMGINSGNHIDVLEMDAASHTGVDNIRDLIDGVGYKPLVARYRIYIIDEVHMLSKGAFNALLKTLEEPPEHVKFIFATTEIRKVPVTILSRCQRFDLKRVSSQQLIKYLVWVCDQESIVVDDEVIRIIVRVSGGSVRDALSLLDQAAALSNDSLDSQIINEMLGLPNRLSSIHILENCLKGDPKKALELYDNVINVGSTGESILSDILDLVHLATRLRVVGYQHENLILDGTSEAEKEGLLNLSQSNLPDLARAWQIILKGIEETRAAPDIDSAGAMILIRLCHASTLPDPLTLIKKIKNIQLGNLQKNLSTSSYEKQIEPAITESKEVKFSKIEEHSKIENPLNFEDVINLFYQKGEKLLHAQMNTCVHLVHFDIGRIDLRITGAGSKNIANEIKIKLSEWTEKSWVINLVDEVGYETVYQKKERQETEKLEAAKKTPEMEKVLKVFPNANLKAIKEVNENGEDK